MSVLDHPILAPTTEAARSTKRAIALTATLVLVILAILLPVMQSSDETAQGYRIRSLQEQQASLQAEIYATQSQIAQLGALSRTDTEGRTRLGMIPITAETDVKVSVPAPSVRLLPNSYVTPSKATATNTDSGSIWQRLLHHLSSS